MSDEKTEEPTHKRLQDAKKKGQHAKSQDAALALQLLGMTVCLSAAAGFSLSALRSVVTRTLDAIGTVSADTELMPFIVGALGDMLLALAPFLGASVLLGIAGQLMQVGFNVSFEPVTPNFDKLNPASGLKKIFSMKSVIEFVKTLLKAIALTAVVYMLITDLLGTLVASAYLPPAAASEVGWDSLIKLFWGAVIVLVAIGPVDYGLQHFLFIKDQRMSKDEVKRDYKETEGDPLIKSKRKQLAYELANSAPRQTVPKASVVVTNPTHYAVALHYEAGRTALPVVVAKGADAQAAEIRRIAEEHQVPIVSDPPLARALYLVPLREPIPRHLFEAVAGILRWVQAIKAGQ